MSRLKPDTEFEDLSTEDDFAVLLKSSKNRPVVLFKHSVACGLSYLARFEMRRFARSSRVPTYQLVVQRSRGLSRLIETRLGIRHESPQVIVLYRGKAVFDASHRQVTARNVRSITEPLTETDD